MAVPVGVALYRDPDDLTVYGVWEATGLVRRIAWVEFHRWGATEADVTLMNTANGTAAADRAAFAAYDKALKG